MSSITTSSRVRTDGVSVVIPVRNGDRWLPVVLDAVLAQRGTRPFEVIVVDDGGEHRARKIVGVHSGAAHITVLEGTGRGAAAAINLGVRAARFGVIAQVDQDVVILPGWLERLVSVLDDPRVGAAQGYYVTDGTASLAARVMGLDLEQRYAAIDGSVTDHVCTGNTVYRASALREAGFFDETLGYGYDNDMSYRLAGAGYRLVLCREARSLHHWRDGFAAYLVQQYGFGYGRIDVVARHRRRVSGDHVSPASMMIHPVLLLLALLVAAIGPFAGAVSTCLGVAGLIVAGLVFERLIAGLRAMATFRDRAALAFPLLHLARDVSWLAAIAVWSARRVIGRPSRPAHSMRPRTTELLG
jgi:cellulose synthase/poly-beta-1,6-N-acetylglucosamine synthase-like glycosyltransferase